jgi:hypothetical protein
MGKSSQPIDNAEDKIAPLRERVRKLQKRQGLDVEGQKAEEMGLQAKRDWRRNSDNRARQTRKSIAEYLPAFE